MKVGLLKNLNLKLLYWTDNWTLIFVFNSIWFYSVAILATNDSGQCAIG